ncbi:MAG: hypothetical protein QXP81_09030 [Nitrososphaerota archaeon]
MARLLFVERCSRSLSEAYEAALEREVARLAGMRKLKVLDLGQEVSLGVPQDRILPLRRAGKVVILKKKEDDIKLLAEALEAPEVKRLWSELEEERRRRSRGTDLRKHEWHSIRPIILHGGGLLLSYSPVSSDAEVLLYLGRWEGLDALGGVLRLDLFARGTRKAVSGFFLEREYCDEVDHVRDWLALEEGDYSVEPLRQEGCYVEELWRRTLLYVVQYYRMRIRRDLIPVPLPVGVEPAIDFEWWVEPEKGR